MYKITLYDCNCCPVSDGTVSFFADDIEDFQKKWLALENDNDRKERFLRSKAGKIVTDYYSDSPELNIVQFDNDMIYGEKEIVLENAVFDAFNAYGCSEKYHVARWNICFKWIRFKNEYFRIASYKAEGVCEYDQILKRWDSASCYGNPVLKNVIEYEPENINDSPELSAFSENCIETICFLTNKIFKNEQDMQKDISHFKITEDVMDRLFSDVIGEAG